MSSYTPLYLKLVLTVLLVCDKITTYYPYVPCKQQLVLYILGYTCGYHYILRIFFA